MLLANTLLHHQHSRDWRYHPKRRHGPHYAQLLRSFVDLPSPKCPFSIHNLIRNGKCFNKRVGTWFGPNEACHMITKCLEESSIDSITAVLSSDGIVYRDQIVSKCETDNGWRSLLLLLPLRLGLQKLNEKYIPALMTCFRMPHSVGFVGGKPQRSLYFVGDQDERLLYLDPHVVRPAPQLTHDFS